MCGYRYLTFGCVIAFVCLTTVFSNAQARRLGGFPERGACFFKDANFQGGHFCVRSGESRSEMPSGFNDRISSVRLFGNANVALFKDHNFQGTRAEIHHDVQDMSRIRGANDKISSLRVF
jgi:beta/gamma crystallin